jgi:hypothetical protein
MEVETFSIARRWAEVGRMRLEPRSRDLATFNLAIESKLRTCDLTKLRVRDFCVGSRVTPRVTFMQQKTQKPVQFEITEQSRGSVEIWTRAAGALTLKYGSDRPRPRVISAAR